jgi:tetratricopeptide (TPR) repeat protein
VTVAAKQEMNIEKLIGQHLQDLDIRYLDNSDIEAVIQKSGGIILTDDYVPVENLLAPVVRKSGIGLLAEKYLEQAKNLRKNGEWDESISRYKEVIDIDPTLSIAAYNDIGLILVAQNRLEEAVDVFKNALEYNEKAEIKQSMSNINYNIGTTLKKLGRDDQASEYLRRAIQEYYEDLRKRPDSVDSVSRLGNALAENGQFSEATKYFQIAVDMNPHHVTNHMTLVQALLVQERYDEAIAALKKAAASMSHIGDTEAAAKLKQYLEFVEFKKANAPK